MRGGRGQATADLVPGLLKERQKLRSTASGGRVSQRTHLSLWEGQERFSCPRPTGDGQEHCQGPPSEPQVRRLSEAGPEGPRDSNSSLPPRGEEEHLEGPAPRWRQAGTSAGKQGGGKNPPEPKAVYKEPILNIKS